MRLGSVKTCKPSVSSLAVTLAFRYICPQIYKKYGERCKLLAFISFFYRQRDIGTRSSPLQHTPHETTIKHCATCNARSADDIQIKIIFYCKARIYFVSLPHMKIFTGSQIHELDKYTIEHEPISSIDLMERAAKALTEAITEEWTVGKNIVVFAGPGNNGGDALAVARMLLDRGYDVDVYLFNISGHLSEDCATNRERLTGHKRASKFTEVKINFDPPRLDENTLVIDGLFGSGLNKPLTKGFASLVKYINQSAAKVISIDLPSGLMTEDNTYNVRANIIKADITLTLQQQKLSMMFADTQPFLGQVKVLDIKLSDEYIRKTSSQYCTTEAADIKRNFRKRDAFAHKGSMGNALLIAGSYGMAGAAVLAAKACMRSGTGKTTIITPETNRCIIQTSVPEAVLRIDPDERIFSEAIDTDAFDSVGIGPGLGTDEETAVALMSQLRRTKCPVVLDADALNIISNHRTWMQHLPANLILTPHPKELDRLYGSTASSDYDRLNNARNLAEHLEAYVILKGHYSALCTPDGSVTFNTTGNAGMATAGSGDVLTGIITGLLARGYARNQACLTGMYIHGLAGDIAARETGEESLVASDIIKCIPKAFKQITDN